LYTKPRLLVLDEATSALDGEVEESITGALTNLRGSVTIVLIAHRLSTVRNSDQVIYLEDGIILSKGNFDQVRKEVPNFDRQASLTGQ
jgi:ABC-type bacteriocin/lantibiotic exporter with double-glycine peptidase domain